MIWPTLEQATIGAGIGSALLACFQGWRSHDLQLSSIIEKTLAGSAIPTGLYLLACAFKPDWVKNIADSGLYLVPAGIALLYVSVCSVFSK
jgi:hypothetical protein